MAFCCRNRWRFSGGMATSSVTYTDHELAQYRWIAMGLSLPVLAMIGRLFITRYGALRGSSTPAKPRRFRIAFPPILSRIPIRLPGRLPAMIWLELRQSMPLAHSGFSWQFSWRSQAC